MGMKSLTVVTEDSRIPLAGHGFRVYGAVMRRFRVRVFGSQRQRVPEGLYLLCPE